MTNFSTISSHYDKSSIIQKSASDELFELVNIKENDDVLDLGCGTGNQTKKIRNITKGNVVGIDLAKGMIDQANKNYNQLKISFQVSSAEEISYIDQFDIIYCNSVFQWFKHPETALKNCYSALRNNGKIAVQAPACKIYSPNFIQAIESVRKNPQTKDAFTQFNPPWCFFETAEEYSNLFKKAGFKVLHSNIDKITTKYTPDEVYKIFESGASAGYLNQKYYDMPINKEYIFSFKGIVKESFDKQIGEDGKVDLIFYRIYLLAKK